MAAQKDVLDVVFQKVANIFKVNHYQKNVLKSLWDGNDCFVCQPTGSGKSIIYQSFPFFAHLMVSTTTTTADENTETEEEEEEPSHADTKNIILVISPLVGLMKDQEIYLNALGLTSTCLRKDVEEDQVDIKVGS